ncbi:MAG: YihY/virulence factor BrkB family protein [Opitutaceae bacterium]|nr:YihY/virulence factor BrkB family protein [Opitutaceae bacterium]
MSPERRPSLWSRLARIYQREIWQSERLNDRSIRGRIYAVLRVISITFTGFNESRIATRAAALSFSSLLGLGPLIALAVLVAGFALGQNDPKQLAEMLNSMIKVVAPQIRQYEIEMQTSNEASSQLVGVITSIIAASRSGSASVFGVFTLLVIVLLLFKAIEDTFNDIWGVGRGRSMLMRVVLYWTILSLGAILFFTAVALQGAGTFMRVFDSEVLVTSSGEAITTGSGGLMLISRGALVQALSFGLLALLLTLVYRVVPNTRVFWWPAFMGGLVVSALLLGNNVLAFLYIKQVLTQKSLYGSLALPFVVMSGLYIFWLCVLAGGIVSYAIQNVHFRNSQTAWSTLTQSTRERFELVVFITICRRFNECLPPISVSMLSTMLRVPTQLVNECLGRLVNLDLVKALRPEITSGETDYLYQPSKPLDKVTLFDFKTLDDNLGEDPMGGSLSQLDPIVGRYEQALRELGEQEFFQKSVADLLREHAFEESRPPFAIGVKPRAK